MAAIMRFFIGKFQAFDQWLTKSSMCINLLHVRADGLFGTRE